MALIVQKFGGTSLAGIERIEKVSAIVERAAKSGDQIIVVVSAMAGVTNSLISQTHQLSLLNDMEHMREYDAIVSSGEIITAGLLALKLQDLRQKAISLQGWQVQIRTNDTFSQALVQEIDIEDLKSLTAQGIIPVITGFQGISANGRVTTLGRGGSDASAVLIAGAVGADRCDIYTDVDGLYSADPRIVHDARKIPHITHLEMLELCASGAKVLHPRAALAGYRYNIDIRILSSFNEAEGTIISQENKNMEQRSITAITSNKNLIQIKVDYQKQELLPELMDSFAARKLQIQHMDMKKAGSLFILANLSDKNAFELILNHFKENHKISFSIVSDIATISILGYATRSDASLLYKILALLQRAQIEPREVFSSDVQISLLVSEEITERAIKLLHAEFV